MAFLHGMLYIRRYKNIIIFADLRSFPVNSILATTINNIKKLVAIMFMQFNAPILRIFCFSRPENL